MLQFTMQMKLLCVFIFQYKFLDSLKARSEFSGEDEEVQSSQRHQSD